MTSLCPNRIDHGRTSCISRRMFIPQSHHRLGQSYRIHAVGQPPILHPDLHLCSLVPIQPYSRSTLYLDLSSFPPPKSLAPFELSGLSRFHDRVERRHAQPGWMRASRSTRVRRDPVRSDRFVLERCKVESQSVELLSRCGTYRVRQNRQLSPRQTCGIYKPREMSGERGDSQREVWERGQRRKRQS
jgi:hypothetical protein